MELAEFIEAANDTPTIDELIRLFRQAIEPYGFNRFICFHRDGARPEIEMPIDGTYHFTKSLHDEYVRLGCYKTDPVYQLFTVSRKFFTWEQIWMLPLSRRQKAILQLRRDNGLHKGINVPIINYDNRLIGMTLASTHPDARTDDLALSFLYAITNQYFLRRRELQYGDQIKHAIPYIVENVRPPVLQPPDHH